MTQANACARLDRRTLLPRQSCVVSCGCLVSGTVSRSPFSRNRAGLPISRSPVHASLCSWTVAFGMVARNMVRGLNRTPISGVRRFLRTKSAIATPTHAYGQLVGRSSVFGHTRLQVMQLLSLPRSFGDAASLRDFSARIHKQ